MDWITEHIAIGNFLDAANPEPGVDFILCLKPECCTIPTGIETVRVPLVDRAGNNPALFRKALISLSQAVGKGRHVLVHCHAGRSRSVSIVAKYLMESRGICADEAIALIAKKREICLTEGIEEVFKEC